MVSPPQLDFPTVFPFITVTFSFPGAKLIPLLLSIDIASGVFIASRSASTSTNTQKLPDIRHHERQSRQPTASGRMDQPVSLTAQCAIRLG
jgi:hypothetical protein